MSKYIIFFISFFFAVGCVPTARNQWVSTIKVKPHEVPVSEAFLERVRANWYYNTKTKCYGINKGFSSYFKYPEKGFDEIVKLDINQFMNIFGQPDIHTDSTLAYLNIDYKTLESMGLRQMGSPTYYEVITWDKKTFFDESNDEIKGAEYYTQKCQIPVYSNVDICFEEGGFEARMQRINIIAKKNMHNYYFYDKRAKHYIWISGFPLPSSCDSKAEVKRLFGKPTKVETNGDLIYYISLPNRYGNPNYIRWSPLPNGKYSVTVNIER